MEGKTICEATCVALLGISGCFLDGNSWLITPVPCHLRISQNLHNVYPSPPLGLPPTTHPLFKSLSLGFLEAPGHAGAFAQEVSFSWNILPQLAGWQASPSFNCWCKQQLGALPFLHSNDLTYCRVHLLHLLSDFPL